MVFHLNTREKRSLVRFVWHVSSGITMLIIYFSRENFDFCYYRSLFCHYFVMKVTTIGMSFNLLLIFCFFSVYSLCSLLKETEINELYISCYDIKWGELK